MDYMVGASTRKSFTKLPKANLRPELQTVKRAKMLSATHSLYDCLEFHLAGKREVGALLAKASLT